ncbi:MAG TPA: DNA polymerase, partial [Steroidobacteraceae bacterium]|nr:DNA polymerase [Steroidobacteraceae bacterium]
MPDSPDLVLVDASSYLYRAFHALPALSNSRGEPTGAVLGVLNMMAKFLKECRPKRIALVFDAPGRTFRDDLFAEYKAHRPPMSDDLRSQIEPLLAILRAQGLPLLRIAGVEADDVIGTLACEASRAGQTVLISTGDKDMAQLVDGAITLVNTMSNTLLDRAGVKAKFDVFPEQIIDYLALVGDSSDNIPGIDKVGPKTAAKLLNQYGTLDNLVSNVREVSGKVGENLRAGLETLELSRKLATIHSDLKLPITLEELVPAEPDTERLRELFTRYELRSLLRQLDSGSDGGSGIGGGESAGSTRPDRAPAAAGADAAAGSPGGGLATALGRPPDGPAPPSAPAVARNYETLARWEDLERWLVKLRDAELIAVDTETTSLDYMSAEIVGISFCVDSGSAAYLPLGHDYAGAPPQLERARALEALRPILEDPEKPKLGHHLKYDAHVLRNHGIRLAGMRYDTMLESYVWNSVGTRHDMDSAALCYLGLRTITYEDVAGKGAKQIPFSQVPVERASEYAAEDADVTLCLHRALWPKIQSIPALQGLYEEIEQPLVPVLARMERRGVLVDRELLKAQSCGFAAQLQELLQQARQEAGFDINVESPKQLQQVLFEKLGLPVVRKTPTGQPSTAED